MSTKKQQTYFFSAALFTTAALAMATIGCSSDPNGNNGSGGAVGAGGAGGAGSGTGGAGGAGVSLGPIVGTPVETFDATMGTFILSNYVPTTAEVNLAGSGTPTMATTTISWDGTEGSPTPGCLKIVAPFSDWNQWVEVQAATQMPLLDWTGKKMHVRLKVGSGFGSDMFALGGAQALVDTTTTYIQVNAAQPVPLGNNWKEFTVDLKTALMPGFDASKVITYGIHIYSGAGNATAAKPTMATLFVDSFSIE